jgi:thiol-disulfide isomerase/thioredoxin
MKNLILRGLTLALMSLATSLPTMAEEIPQHVFNGTLNNVAPAHVLSTILKKYEGKVVLVDIWATWCGPCRMGHKAMEPVKEELKDSDVVFVYLTGPSSPMQTWQEMIAAIPGEQYYLTGEQYSQVLKDNQSGGIPTYLLYDRQGQQVYRQVGFPGASEIKEQIEKALNK